MRWDGVYSVCTQFVVWHRRVHMQISNQYDIATTKTRTTTATARITTTDTNTL